MPDPQQTRPSATGPSLTSPSLTSPSLTSPYRGSPPAPVPAVLPDVPGLAFGGDYNPEQWGRDVWDADY